MKLSMSGLKKSSPTLRQPDRAGTRVSGGATRLAAKLLARVLFPHSRGGLRLPLGC